MIEISFTLNGEPVVLSVGPSERLLDTLRTRLGLTGTKEGCGEGECGACTVIFDGLPANSCLIPAFQSQGRVVETIESVSPDQLEALHASGATQCGACSPGVVMTALWVRRNPEILATHSLRRLMAGNLCRCTGYGGILDGIEAWLEEPGGGGGDVDASSSENREAAS
ncbi:MAG: (2Fe-2S)-binding protein [Deltaproteobacteria bacterium]|nr:(2Fe-2S)-binding protein [Deltaproteobacteria bacterium]